MALPARKITSAGEVTIGTRGDVSLSDDVLRAVGWKSGDRLWATIYGDQIVLMKRPDDIVEYFAGCLTHLYPDPEDTRRFLDELRADWDELERRLDEPWGT